MPAHHKPLNVNPHMTATAAQKPGFRVHPDMLVMPGFAGSLHYPSLRLILEASADYSPALLQRMNAAIADKLETEGQTGRAEAAESNLFQFFVHILYALQQSANLPIHESGHVLKTHANLTMLAIIPSLSSGMSALKSAASWLAGLMNAFLMEQDPAPWLARLPEILTSLRNASPVHSNINLLLKAALKMNIPFIEISNSTYQFGFSAQSRWLLSSFTDSTSTISSSLARNKLQAASLMQRSGIPVPEHFLVPHESAAVTVAQQLGYPVVVKPANLDGGSGVSANLMTTEEVREAYQKAAKLSSQILVEKHIEGRDYRLVVMNDALIWAIERVPGGVTGDGVHTIAELLEKNNQLRSAATTKTLKHIAFDDEAQACLRRAGLNSNDIPSIGQFVRLRSIANIGTGGVPDPVMPEVHPDNRDLAIRAARALRLDIAGIDLLIPDIAVSWKCSGGAICEINAQPQLGSLTSSHLYGQILGTLVRDQGRIHVAVVIGLPVADIRQIADQVSASARINDLRLGIMEKGALFSTGQSLLLDKQIDAALYFVNEDSALRTGLPFDQFNTLIIAGKHEQLQYSSATSIDKRWQSLLSLLISRCQQRIIVLDTAGIKLSDNTGPLTQLKITEARRANLSDLLIDALLAPVSP